MAVLASLLISCGPTLPEDYHMDKKYWAVADYQQALRYMKYTLNKEEGYPRLTDPFTAPVFNKLVDKQNVSIVLEDDGLGVKHRSEVADGFWDVSKDIMNLYQDLDIQDKYVYPIELVKAIDFFLHTQRLYFKIGNQKIIRESVDPDSPEVKRLVKSNEQILVNNFSNYLDFANGNAFSEAAQKELALVFDSHFSKLMNEHPDANYASMKRTIKLLIEKSESESIELALTELLAKIESLQ